MSHSKKDAVGGHMPHDIAGPGWSFFWTPAGKRFVKKSGHKLWRRESRKITQAAMLDLEAEQVAFYDMIQKEEEDAREWADELIREAEEKEYEDYYEEDYYDYDDYGWSNHDLVDYTSSPTRLYFYQDGADFYSVNYNSDENNRWLFHAPIVVGLSSERAERAFIKFVIWCHQQGYDPIRQEPHECQTDTEMKTLWEDLPSMPRPTSKSYESIRGASLFSTPAAQNELLADPYSRR